jgi:hypothetical protein
MQAAVPLPAQRGPLAAARCGGVCPSRQQATFIMVIPPFMNDYRAAHTKCRLVFFRLYYSKMRDPLSRVPARRQTRLYGFGAQYAMRIGLDPFIAARRISPC